MDAPLPLSVYARCSMHPPVYFKFLSQKKKKNLNKTNIVGPITLGIE